MIKTGENTATASSSHSDFAVQREELYLEPL